MLRAPLKTSFHKASALSGFARNLFLANPKNTKPNSRPKDLDDVEQLERIARSHNKNYKLLSSD